jgi:DHA2 family multidrug resistance protein
MNYTAFWAGLVLGPGGVASFFIMPIAGILMRRGVRPRNLLALGLAIMASSIWMMSRFNLEASFVDIALPRLTQGFGLGLFFVPLATATYMTIPREAMGNASGIFNLLRNLGGSFGVAFSATLLSQRAQFHQNFLVEHVTPYNPAFQIRYEQILQWLRMHHADMANSTTVLALVYREVLRQANMLAFNDTFWILAWMTAALVPLSLLFRRGAGGAPPGAAH